MVAPESIAWLPWGEEAFARAAAEQRLILLRIGASWCASCAKMEREADVDPGVVAAVKNHFVPIAVDAEWRPDIDERYNLGGWPTNAFLTPRGELISGGTYFASETLLTLLEGVARSWRERRQEVEDAVATTRREVEQRRRVRPSGFVPGTASVEVIVGLTIDAFDFRYGGFGTEPKFAHTDSIELLLAEFRRTGEARLRDAALLSLDAMWSPDRPHRLADTGAGFFRYSARRDWSEPRFEKVLGANAALLLAYLSAFQLTHDDRWLAPARSILTFVDTVLLDRERGLFGASQAAGMGEGHYALAPEARTILTEPPVDTTVLVSCNAVMASAFIKAGLTLDEARRIDLGIAVADRLAREARAIGDGTLLAHVIGPEGDASPILLSDQVYTARALVDAYEAVGGRHRLTTAAGLLDAVESRLRDRVRDCYSDTIADRGGEGYLALPMFPVAENSVAADTLLRLAALLETPALDARGRALLRAVGGSVAELGFVAAPFGLAVLRSLESEPVTVHIDGADRDTEAARGLARAAHAVYAPFKSVRFGDAGAGAPASNGPRSRSCRAGSRARTP
jgi:uncharacterized protein YyaL (SSP411 family)